MPGRLEELEELPSIQDVGEPGLLGMADHLLIIGNDPRGETLVERRENAQIAVVVGSQKVTISSTLPQIPGRSRVNPSVTFSPTEPEVLEFPTTAQIVEDCLCDHRRVTELPKCPENFSCDLAVRTVLLGIVLRIDEDVGVQDNRLLRITSQTSPPHSTQPRL